MHSPVDYTITGRLVLHSFDLRALETTPQCKPFCPTINFDITYGYDISICIIITAVPLSIRVRFCFHFGHVVLLFGIGWKCLRLLQPGSLLQLCVYMKSTPKFALGTGVVSCKEAITQIRCRMKRPVAAFCNSDISPH
jgi:hypothetical protein